MVARPKLRSGTFQWTTLLYLLLILVFPLVLMGTVQAQGSSATNTYREDLGDGEAAYPICGNFADMEDPPVVGIDLGASSKLMKRLVILIETQVRHTAAWA
jgi:hypothetical protein